jgi:hypothetical protein
VTTLLAGCGHSGGGGGTTSAGSPTVSATPTIAPNAPTAIDGCNLPQSFIDAEHLDSPPTPNNSQNGDAVWRGCTWTAYDGDGFGVDISTTNLTIPMVEANTQFKVVEQLTIDGRQAVTYRPASQADTHIHCLLHAELKGGGLEFSMNNPASNKVTAAEDACQLAKKLAGDLIPTIPASA